MPIDPGIPLSAGRYPQQQGMDIGDLYGKAITMRALLGREALQNLQGQHMQQQIDAFPEQQRLAQEQQNAVLRGERITQADKLNSMLGGAARAVREGGYSQESYDQALAQLKAAGAPPEVFQGIPSQVDRRHIDSVIAQAESNADYLARQKQEFDNGTWLYKQQGQDQPAQPGPQVQPYNPPALGDGVALPPQDQQTMEDMLGSPTPGVPVTGVTPAQYAATQQPGGFISQQPAGTNEYTVGPGVGVGGAPTDAGVPGVDAMTGSPAQVASAGAGDPRKIASWTALRKHDAGPGLMWDENGNAVPMSDAAIETMGRLGKDRAQNITIDQRVERSARIESNKEFREKEYRPTKIAGVVARRANALMDAQANLGIDPKTGWGTDAQVQAARIIANFGVKDAEKYTADAQSFNSILNQQVWTLLGQMPGVQTEGDAQRARDTAAQLRNEPEANRFIRDLYRALNGRAIAKANFYDRNYDQAMADGDISALERRWAEREDRMSIWDDPVMKKWQKPAAPTPPGEPSAGSGEPPRIITIEP